MAHLSDNPELGLVGCWGFECDAANRPTGIRRAPQIGAAMAFERLLVRNFVVPSGVIVPKRCLDAVGGFAGVLFGEDWDLWLRIARRYPIGFVGQPLYKRRSHADSLSSQIGERLFDSYREVGEAHLAHVQPSWSRPLIRRRLHSTASFYAAGYAIDRSRPRRRGFCSRPSGSIRSPSFAPRPDSCSGRCSRTRPSAGCAPCRADPRARSRSVCSPSLVEVDFRQGVM